MILREQSRKLYINYNKDILIKKVEEVLFIIQGLMTLVKKNTKHKIEYD